MQSPSALPRQARAGRFHRAAWQRDSRSGQRGGTTARLPARANQQEYQPVTDLADRRYIRPAIRRNRGTGAPVARIPGGWLRYAPSDGAADTTAQKVEKLHGQDTAGRAGVQLCTYFVVLFT